jgi:hypothetical protein
MQFPRIKEFKFDIKDTYTVPSKYVGRLHRIAFELYGDYKYYKPLAAANNIKLTHGFRVGIRTVQEALETELKNDEIDENEIEATVDTKMSDKRISGFDWYDYSDVSYGYISEVTEGRLLYVPTFNSATTYLNQFEFIEGS